MEERSEWLALDFTRKLIKDIKKEYVSAAVSASQGHHSNSENSDQTQYMNGVAAGNIGAYDTVMELIHGEIVAKEEMLEEEEVMKTYEA